MYSSDLLAQCNYFTSDSLLPLKKIRTEADKKRYEKRGYTPGYTFSEWQQTFPKIDPNHIFYLNVINVKTVYFDAEHFIYVYLPMFGKEFWASQNEIQSEAEFQDYVVKAIQIQTARAQENPPDYAGLFTMYPPGLRMEAMSTLLEKEGETPLFYNIFITLYTTSKFSTKTIPVRLIQALKRSKSDAQKENTAKTLAKHFGDAEMIQVYRGIADRSAAPDEAISWTPNINEAYHFANMLGKKPRIVYGQVRREDIIEYLDLEQEKGTEEEFLVMPGTVRISKIEPLYGITDKVVQDDVDKILNIYTIYKQLIISLYDKFGRKSSDHDRIHSMRVLLYALVLASHLGVSKTGMMQLAEAATFHDIGRVDDTGNTTHGMRSVEFYLQARGKAADHVVEFLIINHCRSDATAKEHLVNQLSRGETKRVWTLFTILKDADALDRIRFGYHVFPGSDGLDVMQLRNEWSKRIVPLAQQAEQLLEG